MKANRKNLFLLAAITLTLTAPLAFAATLTWDTASGDGATITTASGNWNTTALNTVWNNAGTNVIWSQTSTTDGSNAAVFAGTDGTLDQYVITLAAQMAAESILFSNSGYKVTGSTLALMPTTTTNGAITVAANKTATINSAIAYANNVGVTNVINTGSTLNLGGGASNSQYTFNGAGTVNITAGSYEANSGAINVGAFNITDGTYNITPGLTNGYNFGNAVARNVDVRVATAGTLTLNNTSTNNTATAPYIAVGNNTNNTGFTTSLTVQTGGAVTVGTQATRAGEIRISNTGNANGLLDVQGGTVNVGTGNAANQIYLFKAGSNDGYSARITQSGGTMTTNGIQFGGSTGLTTYGSTSSASLDLTGGNLYVGAQGITKGSDASTLATTIKLQGGTLGANQAWSSSLDMQLGTSGGGVTLRAQDAGANSRNITLSGILSNVSAVNGTLTKTGSGTLTLSGSNTYSGATSVTGGILTLSGTGAVNSSSGISVNGSSAKFLQSSSVAVSPAMTLTQGTLTGSGTDHRQPDTGRRGQYQSVQQ